MECSDDVDDCRAARRVRRHETGDHNPGGGSCPRPGGKESVSLEGVGPGPTGQDPLSARFGAFGLFWFFSLDPVIEQAYAGSEKLIVEVNTAGIKPDEMKKVVLAYGLLPKGQTLEAVLPPDLAAKLTAFMFVNQLPPNAFSRFKPWFAGLSVVLIRLAKDGYSAQYGIDQYFIKKGDKEIGQLETMEYQLGLFDGFSKELQELVLMDALEGSIQKGGHLEELFDAWAKGDPDKMEDLILADVKNQPQFEALHQKIIIDRNYTMADSIEGMLGESQRLFVVVGAGHLVGPEGLLEILAKKGYTWSKPLPKKNVNSASSTSL